MAGGLREIKAGDNTELDGRNENYRQERIEGRINTLIDKCCTSRGSHSDLTHTRMHKLHAHVLPLHLSRAPLPHAQDTAANASPSLHLPEFPAGPASAPPPMRPVGPSPEVEYSTVRHASIRS